MSKREKIRLDILLVEERLFPSRSQAQGAIMAGIVYVDGQRIDKAGTKVPIDSEIIVKDKSFPYVSRGGVKLERALDVFEIEIGDKIVMDAGASTGGFTDCLLQRGAKRIYAVDVGYGQLAWSLQQDPRVIVVDRTNVRYINHDIISEEIDLATLDVAFISLAKVFPAVGDILKDEGEIVALIKPQFEVGKGKVGKGGVVRDPELHKEVLQEVISAAYELNLSVRGITYSPLMGPAGNIEFFIYLSKGEATREVIDWSEEIERVVEEAHYEVKT